LIAIDSDIKEEGEDKKETEYRLEEYALSDGS
jgi:hypothetical protein